MANYTENYNLVLPEASDFYDIDVQNENFKTVDAELKNKVDKETGKGLSSNDFTDALQTKLNGIEEGADANVNSDWNATSGDAQILNKPTKLSDFTNDGFATEDYVTTKISSTYKAKGSMYFENLPDLDGLEVGYVYNILDDFVTTADFAEGVGIEYPAGTNVVVAEDDDGDKQYDALSGMIDLSYLENPVFTETDGLSVDDDGNTEEIENISSGESIFSIFGKIRKWFYQIVANKLAIVELNSNIGTWEELTITPYSGIVFDSSYTYAYVNKTLRMVIYAIRLSTASQDTVGGGTLNLGYINGYAPVKEVHTPLFFDYGQSSSATRAPYARGVAYPSNDTVVFRAYSNFSADFSNYYMASSYFY